MKLIDDQLRDPLGIIANRLSPESRGSLRLSNRYFRAEIEAFPYQKRQIKFSQIKNRNPEIFKHILNLFYDSSEDFDFSLFENLKILTFGNNFNHFIDNLPPFLEELYIGYWFNRPVDHLPKHLRILVFGNNFNKPVDHLPKYLRFVKFGTEFNKSIDKLPDSLVEITLRKNFNQRIHRLPQSLENIDIDDNYPYLDDVEQMMSRFELKY